MDNKDARHHDSRDSRTGENEAARPVEQRDLIGEARSTNPDTETIEDIEAGRDYSGYRGRGNGDDGILDGEDEEIDDMIDPGRVPERMSNNPDVLDLDPSWRVESEEPDFADSPGTTDIIEAIEEGEPYFPPTDPPVRPDRLDNAGMLGGFAATSLEEPTDDVDHPIRLLTNDEEIAERVRYALAADAYTTDLNIEVEVNNGTVYLTGRVASLEEAEQAEQVAGDVAGVEEVEENLEIV
jgi:hypothetical protein